MIACIAAKNLRFSGFYPGIFNRLHQERGAAR